MSTIITFSAIIVVGILIFMIVRSLISAVISVLILASIIFGLSYYDIIVPRSISGDVVQYLGLKASGINPEKTAKEIAIDAAKGTRSNIEEILSK